MQDKGESRESSRHGPAQLHRLRDLLQRRDAEGFATELNLDPTETRLWFDRGFGHDGYGAEVVRAVGTLVLERILQPQATVKGAAMTGSVRDSQAQSDTRTPLWVKVFGGVLLAAILLFLILMFARGPHRPGGHMPSGGHTPPRSGHL